MHFQYLLAFLHLQWLYFLSKPEVFFWEGPGAVGFGIPFFVSVWIFFRYRGITTLFLSNPISRMMLGFLLTDILVGVWTLHWHHGSVSMIPFGEIIWPLMAFLLTSEEFPVGLSYPFAFVGALVPDIYAGGELAHWIGAWYAGIGGAGYQDGLFMVPVLSLVLAVVLRTVSRIFRRKGWFRDGPMPSGLPDVRQKEHIWPPE